MPYGKYIIDEELTFIEFGYNSNELEKMSTKPVKAKCQECGTVSIKKFNTIDRMHRCESVIDGKKRCFKCKSWLLLDEFSKNRHRFDGYQKVCKKCFSEYECVKKNYNKKSEKIKKDELSYFKHRASTIRRSAKKKNLECDIDGEYLLFLYKKQDEKCFYSGQSVTHNSGVFQHDSISVDRLDPSKGYVRGNLVICSFVINSFKNSMNVSEFKTYLISILPSLQKFAEGV